MTRPLPHPSDIRWKPLRAGLVDVFYYDIEEFWFRDGRLLLRGNNGTGKSKVLALLLPFLFDGDLSAHRVEPDADPRKRMEWNLLLGGAHPHPERVGYTWLEFGRRDADGAQHFVTLGCGMKAVTGHGVSPWFFITAGRIGEQLHLVDGRGTPMTRDRLVEALGEHGQRYDTARQYRRAVDEVLFGLGEQRYGALVDLLIALRQPQLSKKPTESALSRALTESLPPLAPGILVDVADAFRSLEEDRLELADMREALEVSTEFLGHYRRYAQVATRRKAELSRLAQSEYERINRKLGEANRDCDEAKAKVSELDARVTALVAEQAKLADRRRALEDSEEMKSARDLDGARRLAEKTAENATRLEGFRNDAETDMAQRTERFEAAEAKLVGARSGVDTAAVVARDAAAGAALADPHEQEVDAKRDSGAVRELRQAADVLIARQRSALDNLTHRIDAVETAQRALAAARQRCDELEGQLSKLDEERTAADDALHVEVLGFTEATRQYLMGTTELTLPAWRDLIDELPSWAQTLGGANPVAAAASARVRELTERFTREDAAAEATERDVRATRADLSDELRQLEDGRTASPPVRHTLTAIDRDGRAGAPLWRVVDFVGGTSDAARAGVEAALEAAGLLDAWVSPEGELVAAGETIVTAAEPAEGPTLADVLVPAPDPDANIADSVVAGVLGAIGLGAASAHHSWVDVDGHFRLGALTGAWTKPDAQFLGAGAREQARRRRIAVLRDQIAHTERQLTSVEQVRHELTRRRAILDAEHAGMPSEAALRGVHELAARLAHRQAEVRADLTNAHRKRDSVTANHTTRVNELDADAADSGLPATRVELAAIRDSLGEYRWGVARLCDKLDALADATQAAQAARGDLERVAARHAELSEQAADERTKADGEVEYHRTLEANVGAAVEKLQSALRQVASDTKVNATSQREAGSERDDWVGRKGGAQQSQQLLGDELVKATAARQTATDTLQNFARTGLIRVALPELDVPDHEQSWVPNPTVLLARSIDTALASVDYDDKIFERMQSRIVAEHKTLGDVLSRQGNSTAAQPVGDSIVVDIVFRGKVTTVPDLAELLADEVTDRSRLLSEREREILENHLVSEVASTLQELIVAAEQQVAQMNRELSARPTSTGMRLRMHWRPTPDAPAGAEAAQRQLRKTADVWNESDRAAVGAFLQGEIERVRTERVGGTWLEHLTEALDYRGWNRFVIERHQNGQWRPAVGPASGGEGALVASVPLFAAASSHYSSAGNPHAPRLVTLDEAFAGVDDNARAKYLGLLTAFDLDVVMTSEREWGCYPDVPGLSIAHLSRIDGVDAVLVTNWEWDGNARTKVDRPVPALLPVGAADERTEQDGLWAND